MTASRRQMIAMTLASPFALSAPSAAAVLDDLYPAAKAEGALTMYTGGVVANSASTVKAFNARFPGIDVTVIGAYSNVNDIIIDRQLRDGNVTADIASFQTVQDFVRWKRAGRLLPFTFEGFELYENRYKDLSGAFCATNLNPLTYAYNTKLVLTPDVPKSALDFLHPRFRGQAITCYPHDDDATLYLFYTLTQKYGWSFMDKYMANAPFFVEGHAGVVAAIAGGKKAVSFDNSEHTALEAKDRGAPIDIRYSALDPTPVFYNTIAILQAAPHPNAAKLYVTWLLSKDQQIATRNWSARRDVPPPYGAAPLTSHNLADRYREFLVDDALVTSLRKRFLAYTGPVVNTS
ncbi:MAG TPA: extracellular solute-binding protein [Candidatus Lustribacter sp.]|nr:extracellular solute-binding protein [Candidatus Lustribacter sp.]